MRSVTTILLGTMLILQGCAPDAALVTDGAGAPLPYSVIVASGSRDGYYLIAELGLFTSDLINELNLQLRIEIGVVPKLLKGSWTKGSNTGSISAEGLQFFGGQGGSPIIAGRFRLHSAASDTSFTYIVNLPKTEIKRRVRNLRGRRPLPEEIR